MAGARKRKHREGAAGGGRRGAHLPPLLLSVRDYRRGWLTADLLAGVTLVAIAVPEQLATARLAGMPVVAGLYSFLAAAVVFTLLGSSRQLSVGADSTIAPMLAAGVVVATRVDGTSYGATMALLTLMVGVVVVVVGLARLGWVAGFLSVPVVTGFLAGIAITIIVRQLPAVLGIPEGSGIAIRRLVYTLTHLGDANLPTVVLSVLVITLIFVSEYVDRRIPGALIAVVLSTAAVPLFDLTAHGVAVLGKLPAGLPSLTLPPWSAETLWQLVPAALSVALIVITQTSATTRAFAEAGDYEVDIDRDFIAVGAGSLLAGVMSGFAVNASPPRTGVVASSGGRSQVPTIVAALLVLVVVVVGGVALQDLPQATLGAVLIFVATRIFHTRELAAIWRFDRREFAVAAITLLTVPFVGVGPGILVAVILSILDRTWRSARPGDAVLGRIPGTTVWWPLRERPDCETVPGVIAYRIDSPLYFANATYFHDRIAGLVRDEPTPPRLFVLDSSGVDDLDFTAGRALGRLVEELRDKGTDFAIARASGELPRDAARAGVRRHVGSDHMFVTVDDAVRALALGKDPHTPALGEHEGHGHHA